MCRALRLWGGNQTQYTPSTAHKHADQLSGGTRAHEWTSWARPLLGSVGNLRRPVSGSDQTAALYEPRLPQADGYMVREQSHLSAVSGRS